jgi:hypothetical protein
MEVRMPETAQPTKLTKGQKAALKAIAGGSGTFHRIIGERLEALGLAFPVAGLQNFLASCNARTAWGWALTDKGAEALRQGRNQANAQPRKIDKSAVLKDAHLRYRQGLRLRMGWSFAQCLRTAWAAAHQRQQAARHHRSADRRHTHARDVLFISSAALAA